MIAVDIFLVSQRIQVSSGITQQDTHPDIQVRIYRLQHTAQLQSQLGSSFRFQEDPVTIFRVAVLACQKIGTSKYLSTENPCSYSRTKRYKPSSSAVLWFKRNQLKPEAGMLHTCSSAHLKFTPSLGCLQFLLNKTGNISFHHFFQFFTDGGNEAQHHCCFLSLTACQRRFYY